MTASSHGLRLTTVWIWSVRRWWDGGAVFVRLLLTSYIHLSSSMRDDNTWDVWPVMTRLSLWHGVMAPRQREEPVVASRCIRFLEVNNGLIGGVRLGFVKDGDVYDLYSSLVYFKLDLDLCVATGFIWYFNLIKILKFFFFFLNCFFIYYVKFIL